MASQNAHGIRERPSGLPAAASTSLAGNPGAQGFLRSSKVRSRDPPGSGVNRNAYPTQNRNPRLGSVLGALNMVFMPDRVSSAYYVWTRPIRERLCAPRRVCRVVRVALAT